MPDSAGIRGSKMATTLEHHVNEPHVAISGVELVSSAITKLVEIKFWSSPLLLINITPSVVGL